MFLLLVIDQVLQMLNYFFSNIPCVSNAVGRALQVHFHFVYCVFVDTCYLVNIVQVLLPPMLVVKKLQRILHYCNNCPKMEMEERGCAS